MAEQLYLDLAHWLDKLLDPPRARLTFTKRETEILRFIQSLSWRHGNRDPDHALNQTEIADRAGIDRRDAAEALERLVKRQCLNEDYSLNEVTTLWTEWSNIPRTRKAIRLLRPKRQDINQRALNPDWGRPTPGVSIPQRGGSTPGVTAPQAQTPILTGAQERGGATPSSPRTYVTSLKDNQSSNNVRTPALPTRDKIEADLAPAIPDIIKRLSPCSDEQLEALWVMRLYLPPEEFTGWPWEGFYFRYMVQDAARVLNAALCVWQQWMRSKEKPDESESEAHWGKVLVCAIKKSSAPRAGTKRRAENKTDPTRGFAAGSTERRNAAIEDPATRSVTELISEMRKAAQ